MEETELAISNARRRLP